MPSPRLYPATRVALTIVLAAQAAAMFLLPQAVAIHSAWGLLLVPLASTHHTLWSLVHEAIHGTLATPSRLNERLGRLLAVLHGAPFAVLRLGHLLHHRHNRSALDAAECYDPARRGAAAAAAGYYARLRGGLYLAEVAAGVLLLLPRSAAGAAARRLAAADPMVALMAQRLLEPATLRIVRVDVSASLLLWTGAALWWGDQAWMLGGFVALRALAISLTDNLHHYGTPLGERRYATDLAAPRWLGAVLLDFQFHGVHHRHPALP
jgi:fatty acid desaturase